MHFGRRVCVLAVCAHAGTPHGFDEDRRGQDLFNRLFVRVLSLFFIKGGETADVGHGER